MTTVLVRHEPACPRKGFGHTDDAKRCADAVNLHLAAVGFDAANKIVACNLSDGGSDGVLYPDYESACRFQRDPQRCFYIKVPLHSMPICDAEGMLITWRKLAAAGFRTDCGRVPIPRLTLEDQARTVRALGN